nr:immunoglobulin light chain junction region [Macaca mulatta]
DYYCAIWHNSASAFF